MTEYEDSNVLIALINLLWNTNDELEAHVDLSLS